MRILLSVILLSGTLSLKAGDLNQVLLATDELPDGIHLMEPTPKMPRFCNGMNPAVTTDEAGIKEFCRTFLLDESLASRLRAVSFTAFKVVNELGIFGHRLKDPEKSNEIKKAYEFLTTKVSTHRFIESGDLLILIWAKDETDITAKLMDQLEARIRAKLGKAQ